VFLIFLGKDAEDGSDIQKWMKDRAVFVTGATGFVGSVLCEKILRSCPGLSKMYVLVRGRKGVSAEARMQETLKTEVSRL